MTANDEFIFLNQFYLLVYDARCVYRQSDKSEDRQFARQKKGYWRAISAWASGADSTLELFRRGGWGTRYKMRCTINMTEVLKLGDKTSFLFNGFLM